LKRHDREAEEPVMAKVAALNEAAEIGVGGGDDPG
jgi:hypothetical protein